MQGSDLPFLGFWIASIIFIWIDILLGHLGGKLQNVLMWIPLLALPLASLNAIKIIVQGPR